MRRADELLVTSLKSEERRRNRRRITLVSLGVFTMLGILVAVLLSLTAETEKGGQLAQEGWNLWKNQQFAEAIDKFQEAVKADPKNTDAWNGLGWSQFNSGNADAATQSFGQVLKLAPNHAAAQNGLGQILLSQGKLDEAKAHFEKAASQDASAAWYGLARIDLLQGKFDEAAKWARKVVNSGDTDELAKQMLQAANDKKLSAELRKQIEPPKQSAASKDVGKAWQLMNQGRRDEAKTLLDAQLAQSPDDAAVLNTMGWYCLTGGEMDQAALYFEKALKADPDAAGAMNGLARVLKSKGRTEEAVKLWQQMVDKFPAPNAGTAGLADVYMDQGDYKKAVPLLEQLAKSDPQNQEFKNKLARAQEEAGK